MEIYNVKLGVCEKGYLSSFYMFPIVWYIQALFYIIYLVNVYYDCLFLYDHHIFSLVHVSSETAVQLKLGWGGRIGGLGMGKSTLNDNIIYWILLPNMEYGEIFDFS